MKEPDLEEIVIFKNETYLLKNYFNKDFSKLKKASQCYGLVLNDKNEIFLVSDNNKEWTLPGGTPEENESNEETLVREIYEESAVKINVDTIKPFFYIIVYKKVKNKFIYHTTQLRFIAQVESIDEFIKDPGGNKQYRRFVELKNLDKFLTWKEIAALIKDKFV